MFHTKFVEKIKTYFMLDNLFSKIMPFTRKCGKIFVKLDRTHDNMAHAHFMIDT